MENLGSNPSSHIWLDILSLFPVGYGWLPDELHLGGENHSRPSVFQFRNNTNPMLKSFFSFRFPPFFAKSWWISYPRSIPVLVSNTVSIWLLHWWMMVYFDEGDTRIWCIKGCGFWWSRFQAWRLSFRADWLGRIQLDAETWAIEKNPARWYPPLISRGSSWYAILIIQALLILSPF